jgi:hypothetical protein
MPYPNFHACRVAEPGSFIQSTFRNMTLPKSEGGKGGVQVIMAKKESGGSMMAQAYRFPVELYTEDEAKAWLKKNNVKCLSFEAATP